MALDSRPARFVYSFDMEGAVESKWHVFELDGQIIRLPLVDRALSFWPVTGDYQLWDQFHYELMGEDEPRNARYREAIRQLVPGRTVVDLGTGMDMLWARECVKAGAKRVYAIEAHPVSYAKAKSTLKPEEPITLVFGQGSEVELPEKVDVIVSELVGELASSEGATRAMRNALRFLKPGGRILPERAATPIAAVQLPDNLARQPGFDPEGAQAIERLFRRELRPFDARMDLGFEISRLKLISGTAYLEDLDFTRPFTESYATPVELTIQEDGRLDGLLAWVHLWVLKDLPVLDTFQEETNWFPVYFPLFQPGLPVRAGDEIEAVCITSYGEGQDCPDYVIKGRLKGSVERTLLSELPFRSPNFRATPFYQALFRDPAP